MFGLTEWKQTRFYQEVSAEGYQKGHQKGHQEGRQEGGQEKQLEIALKLLELGSSIELVAEGTGLSVEQVQQLQQQSDQSSQN
ncbi:MAG: Rpn family recombination-promoting nuclease/putative transposase [Symploca sp. SIO2C1]|nr:Rpn family recombination-promoting nuclease/putative transposase [Symploca sp. SIO2C1]